jgi:hypothetical protein
MANEEFEMEPPPSYLTCHYSIDNNENKSFKYRRQEGKVKRVQATTRSKDFASPLTGLGSFSH